MGQRVLILFLLITLLIVLWTVTQNVQEGFVTVEDALQDRFNPLASQQNPLTNPAAPIGISEEKASNLRNLTEAALNSPTLTASGDGGFVQEEPTNPNSVRIDTENSLLGMVNFCKTKGKESNPFSDSKFSQNCGMCMSSGTLLTGETFNTPTGVVVYQKDKEKANQDKITNNYLFPRVIPSMGAATCVNASVGADARPAIAINATDYENYKKRVACRLGGVVGNGCGICESTNTFSWVDPAGGIQSLSLVFWGEGTLTLSVAGRQVGQTVTLSPTIASRFQLGQVSEGASVSIDVRKGNAVAEPYIYGALIGTNPNGTAYNLPVEKMIEKDSVTGAMPRRLLSKTFTEVNLRLVKLVAKVRGDRMTLVGAIPLTFVTSDQLASFDCPAGPLVTLQASAELMIDDPCLRPKGQKIGNYSEACLQSKVLEGECSTDGTYYSSPPAIGNRSLAQYLQIIKDTKAKELTDPTASMQCRGVDISTPCDAFIGNTNIPSKECMIYLYKNTGDKTTRASQTASYPSAGLTYTSLDTSRTQYCQPDGTLNPEKADGLLELQDKAKSYSGKKGFEAVKQYLSDTFTKAIGNLDINKEDSAGGRKTSWMKCFGVPIAEPVSASVLTTASGSVTGRPPALPTSFIPKRNTLLADNFFIAQDYRLSFKITARGRVSGWGNIIRFTGTTANCCTNGDRVPAIWFGPNDTAMHVCIGDTTDGNWYRDTLAVPLNQETQFVLECRGKTVSIRLGSKTDTYTQTGTRWSGMGKVFGSDSFHTAANAEIKDLSYERL